MHQEHIFKILTNFFKNIKFILIINEILKNR